MRHDSRPGRPRPIQRVLRRRGRRLLPLRPILHVFHHFSRSPSDSLADETGCAEAPNSGSVLGAVALITGSTVGAGILALPETIAPAGIGPSSAVLRRVLGAPRVRRSSSPR